MAPETDFVNPTRDMPWLRLIDSNVDPARFRLDFPDVLAGGSAGEGTVTAPRATRRHPRTGGLEGQGGRFVSGQFQGETTHPRVDARLQNPFDDHGLSGRLIDP